VVSADPVQERATLLSRRKPEDTAEGCRRLARDNRDRAASSPSEHMRHSLERSAEAWMARSHLLERLEANFNARAASNTGENPRQRQLEGRENG
jgi:hypothetical protein